MILTLSLADIINDVRANIAIETSDISDESKRSLVELASKAHMLKRIISDASANLQQNIHRFLMVSGTDVSDDSVIEEDLKFNFIVSQRRFDGKEKSICLKLHEALVDITLQRFYASVGLEGYLKLYSAQSKLIMTELNAMLRQKGVPKLVEP